jgi:O-Antigen ligase
MSAKLPLDSGRSEGAWPGIFAGMFGALLGLALVKFGDTVILEREVTWPREPLQWIIYHWPVVIGYWVLGMVTVAGLFAARGKIKVPWVLAMLPLAWLIWEILAGTQTINTALTHVTTMHFASCVLCFYLGLFSLGRVSRLWPFWAGLFFGYTLALGCGFDQHFGGLEDTREYTKIYVKLYLPSGTEIPQSLKDRMASDRIFSTLFYPDAFAGAILLLMPATLGAIGQLRTQFTAAARRLLMMMAGCVSLVCLYWTGSKAGWLIMLVLGLIAALFLPIKRPAKLALVGAALVLGLAGFFVKYLKFFQKGAPSVVARFDYWTAAVQTTEQRPLFGSGPGTFGIAYEKIKKPESEPTRMTHNDYLEQASDSGIPGFILYTTMVIGTLAYTFRKCRDDRLALSVWLGVLGWALQSLVEFGLYIPAIAWISFAFMGWLLARGSSSSTTAASGGRIPAWR